MMPLLAKDTPPRDAFAALWEALRAMRYPRRDDPLNLEFQAAVVAAARAQHPRRRNLSFDRAAKLLSDEEFAAIKAPYQARADEISKRYFDEQKRIKRAMWELAATCDIQPGETTFVLFSRSSSDYGSQGFGASSYARNRCQMEVLFATSHGVPAELVERKDKEIQVHGPWSAGPIRFFEVQVKLQSPLDVEILRHRAPPPLREQVRQCWKLGLNPRVLMPGLDPDYEQKVGIDHFGNDLRSAS